MGSVSEDRQASFSPGLAIKQPVRLATTANIAFVAGAPNGLSVVDGVQTVSGDRVLLKNQADPTQNGIWEANSGVWTRTPDFDGIRDVANGTIVLILAGGQSGQLWRVATNDPITPGSTALTFSALIPIFGVPVPGGVLFGAAGDVVSSDAANLFWDNTNKRLGIGQPAPTVSLDVTGAIRATTSLVTPVVSSVGDLTFQQQGVQNTWLIKSNAFGSTLGDLIPAQAGLNIGAGTAASVVGKVFTTAIDSGTTGSLSLQTNNGTVGFRVLNNGGFNFFTIFGAVIANAPTLRADGGDTNISAFYSLKGSGTHTFITDGLNTQTVQLEIPHTSGANRHITITGSNGGNPTIGVTGGNLGITPNVTIAGSLQVGTTPALSGLLALPYASAISARNQANSADISMLICNTVNSVNNVVRIGIGSTAGVEFSFRQQAGLPTTSDIPAGSAEVWKDTSGGTIKLYVNDAGSLKSVALV